MIHERLLAHRLNDLLFGGLLEARHNSGGSASGEDPVHDGIEILLVRDEEKTEDTSHGQCADLLKTISIVRHRSEDCLTNKVGHDRHEHEIITDDVVQKLIQINIEHERQSTLCRDVFSSVVP